MIPTIAYRWALASTCKALFRVRRFSAAEMALLMCFYALVGAGAVTTIGAVCVGAVWALLSVLTEPVK